MPTRMVAVLLTLAVATLLPAAAAVAEPSAGLADEAAVEAPQEPDWAPVGSATIRPGVRISSQSGGCTTNFIFYERHEDEATGEVTFDVYIGLAAHCFTLGGSTGTNGCTTPTRPLGSTANITGATHPGTLAYSSWVTVKEVNETSSNVCATNDFALVKLDPRDHDKVNPSMLYFGGPTGLRTTATSAGNMLYSYGNSSLRPVSQLSPKRGWSTGTTNGGWSHRVYTVTPGVPGDSGSAFVDADGRAMGVVVTLQLAPFPASNGVTDMARALGYANENTDHTFVLANGTEPFTDPILP